MNTRQAYAIERNGKYLTGLFPYEFTAIKPTRNNCYWYYNLLIAHDIAEDLNAQVVELND